jgi:Putative abortive phage resistance protein AbiGi, antitoxin
MHITEILARRTDLSTFLVHLSREFNGQSAKQNLLSIIRSGVIEARSAFGMAAKKLEAAHLPTESQRCVCFTETPLQHVNLLTEEIDGRTYRFERYGIAVTRKQGRRSGVNPVWYLDITEGHPWLTEPAGRLIDDAIGGGRFEGHGMSRLAPFIEQMGTGTRAVDGQPYMKEFWWEREWRNRGAFHLPNSYIVLCPAGDMREFRAAVDALDEFTKPSAAGFVDPMWSLEMIIGGLAGMRADELGPF